MSDYLKKYLYICKTQMDVQSVIGVQFSNLWPFLIFSNRHLMTSLAYALTLTLTNKSAIDLRI